MSTQLRLSIDFAPIVVGVHCVQKVRVKNHLLIQGDCFEVLPRLGLVDIVVTDPPYVENTHKNVRSNKGGKVRNKRAKPMKVNFDAMTGETFADFVNGCVEASKGWVLMTCDHLLAPYTFHLDSFIRVGAWVKTNPMPQVSGDRPGQGHECILIHHSGRVPKVWNGGGKPAIWTGPRANNAQYPTQKPLWLINRLLEDFAAKRRPSVVLDPMMGSGTTGVAAAKLGHAFIGIECDHKAFSLAVQNMRDAGAVRPMFNRVGRED